jgi:hypothetical protein
MCNILKDKHFVLGLDQQENHVACVRINVVDSERAFVQNVRLHQFEFWSNTFLRYFENSKIHV